MLSVDKNGNNMFHLIAFNKSVPSTLVPNIFSHRETKHLISLLENKNQKGFKPYQCVKLYRNVPDTYELRKLLETGKITD